MKLLILGGTRFVGRHLVDAALARNHEVTVFNRGQHAPDLRGVETIHGDRHRDLSKLRGRQWDAVIDTSGYLPRAVKASVEALADSHYVFLSSVSVYSSAATPTPEEVARANDVDTSGQVSATSYGPLYGGLKALCEQALPKDALIIRPGLIVGPYDYTDRFTYWVMRLARGGEILAPGRPDRRVQFIDVRDLAEWIVRMIEKNATGVYDATGLPITMQAVLGTDASLTWVSEEFLLQENVTPWTELPLWLPHRESLINSDQAITAGLTFRDLKETMEAIRQSNPSEPLRAGLDADKERELLRKWHLR